MQDPSATYIEAKLGQEAVLPCFALGTPTPITRSVFFFNLIGCLQRRVQMTVIDQPIIAYKMKLLVTPISSRTLERKNFRAKCLF